MLFGNVFRMDYTCNYENMTNSKMGFAENLVHKLLHLVVPFLESPHRIKLRSQQILHHKTCAVVLHSDCSNEGHNYI